MLTLVYRVYNQVCVLECITALFAYSMLHLWEIYALENVVFYIVVYELYKP